MHLLVFQTSIDVAEAVGYCRTALGRQVGRRDWLVIMTAGAQVR